jgi:hypothetical protein
MYHRGGTQHRNVTKNTAPGSSSTVPGSSSSNSNSTWSSTDTCASLFPRTRKLKVDIEMSLDDLEKTRGGLNEVAMAKLTKDLSDFFMNIEQMEELLSKEYNQRNMWQK